jgi:hypothetical protein
MIRKKKFRRCSRIDRTVRIYLSLVVWPLCILQGHTTPHWLYVLLGFKEMRWPSTNLRMRFLDAFIGGGLSLSHISLFFMSVTLCEAEITWYSD